jgi:hypothetical protein
MAMNASGYSRLPSVLNFIRRQRESNVYDELKALRLAPGKIIAALGIRTQSTGASRIGGGSGNR